MPLTHEYCKCGFYRPAFAHKFDCVHYEDYLARSKAAYKEMQDQKDADRIAALEARVEKLERAEARRKEKGCGND